jgi:hypothetical protein
MFATIKSLIPEPRRANQPRYYVGRHRRPEPAPAVPVSPAPTPIVAAPAPAPAPVDEPAEEATAVA